MEVTETLSDGLKREFQVQVPAADLEARVTERLGELKDRVQLRGFRPGKVPVTHLRKIYGKAVMAETIEAIIRELNAKIVSDRGLKLAMEPKVTIPNEATAVEKVIVGQSDLAYTLALEILPKIELGDFKGIKLERQVAEVTDAQINEALDRIAEQNRPFAAKAQGAKLEKGDRVVTQSGLVGRLVSIEGRYAELELPPSRTKVTILRSGLLGRDAEGDASSAEPSAEKSKS